MTTELMRCDWCGSDFPADPRCCLEGGVEIDHDIEEGDEWKGGPELPSANSFTRQDREDLKRAFGIDDRQVEELITRGKVEGVGVIVCLRCQEEASIESDE